MRPKLFREREISSPPSPTTQQQSLRVYFSTRPRQSLLSLHPPPRHPTFPSIRDRRCVPPRVKCMLSSAATLRGRRTFKCKIYVEQRVHIARQGSDAQVSHHAASPGRCQDGGKTACAWPAPGSWSAAFSPVRARTSPSFARE